MTLRRRIHFLCAWLGGYFWLPCHHCGRPFGGHERGHVLMTSMYGGFATCAHPGCARDVQRLNAAFLAAHGAPAKTPERVPA